jgi:hypothetical protein
MHINPADETSYTIQYQEGFLENVENEYWAMHTRLLVIKSHNTLINNLGSFKMSSRSGQSSYFPYNLCRDDNQNLTPTNVAETTPGRRDRAACLLTAARLYSN